MATLHTHLSDAHYKAIGSLVVACSRFESVITDLIALFMKAQIHHVVIAIDAQKVSSKIETLRAFFNLAWGDAPEFAEINDMLAKASHLSDERNSVSHAYWLVEPGGAAQAVRFSSKRGKFHRSKRAIDASTIQGHADAAHALAAKLAKFRDHMLASGGNGHPQGG